MTDAKPRTKRYVLLVVFGGLLLLSGHMIFRSLRASRQASDGMYSSSCANHFIQLRMKCDLAGDGNPDLILPATEDTRVALRAICEEASEREWLQGGGAACPESFDRDKSIGYVYIGDGLRLGDVMDRGILILFCPGENHRRGSEHCHAFPGTDWSICKGSNREMIAELEHALERGKSGGVPYSARAMAVLQREVEKRRKPPSRW